MGSWEVGWVMSGRVDGQTAIVTGAAQGIGRGIARRLGEEGANVVLADVNEAKAEATAEAFRATGITCLVVGCDVTDPEETAALAEAAVEAYGSVEVLVNNAGVSTRGSFTELDHDEWHRVLEVNLTGVFNCSIAVVPVMVESGYGRVVNISSMAGRNISYHAAANYTASKWGVIGLTKHMAWDLGPHGITVNAVCPGSTITPLIESQTSEADRAATTEKIPARRWAQPDDHAAGVLYLVSEAGSYVTGTAIEIDGGKQLGVRHGV